MKTYQQPRFDAPCTAAEQAHAAGAPQRVPVVVVGAGPVGMTAALDLAQRGLPVLLLDDNDTVSIGSRAVCYAKRTLEVWNRLGVVASLLVQGVRWQVGKVFVRDALAYRFDLLPEQQHQMPAMINLQQYYLEEALVDAIGRQPGITLAWKHQVQALHSHPDHVLLHVHSPTGRFEVQADYVLACDGANSSLRGMLGARFDGQVFHDRFLIADVVMPEGSFPTERWFWFDPPFHPGQSVLLHKQAAGVWRIDFQLGPEADPEEEKKPENVLPRIRAMLGPQAQFELEWVSVYQFACRRIEAFCHGRVLFAGDSAHQVSPFGARGCNSGVQDADNLAWKLAAVLKGQGTTALLESYHHERSAAANDNLGHSTRSTDFITPKTAASRRLRDAVLELARTEPFARPLVNSGRLSLPTAYEDSPLNTPDDEGAWVSPMRPGSPCADGPLGEGWLLETMAAWDRTALGFGLLHFGPAPVAELTVALEPGQPGVCLPVLAVLDSPVLFERYDGRIGTTLLIRPDQHIAARWRRWDAAAIGQALLRALGHAVLASAAEGAVACR
jgi:3-(3-hydroxy-phenyl)propionate hydroxylase